MNAIHLDKVRFTPFINSQVKFEKLVWRLLQGLA